MVGVLVLLLCFFYGIDAKAEVSVLVVVKVDTPVVYLRQTLESLSSVSNSPEYQVLLVQVGTFGYEKEFEFQRVVQKYKDFVVVPGQEGDSEASALNKASFLASGEYIVFMDSMIELVNPEAFDVMVNAFEKDPSVGIVGAKIIFPDETIYHFGLEFVFEPDTWTWGVSGQQYLSVAYSLQGFATTYPAATFYTDVPAVSKSLMMIPERVFRESGRFEESLITPAYVDADLSLKVADLGYDIVIDPEALALHNNKDSVIQGFESPFYVEKNRQDLVRFGDKWPKITTMLEDSYKISNFTLIWNCECGSGQVLGFTAEAIHFVMSLYKKVPLVMDVGSGRENDCLEAISKLGYPAYVQQVVRRAISSKVKEGGDVALVLHRDPGRYNWFLNSYFNKKDYFIIGRSMYETDGIPSDWVAPCNSDDIDEIWVPTEFNRETFSESGVNASKLFIVPELTDVLHFKAETHEPLLSRTVSGYTFLSIQKWEERKAWKSLLRAYFDEFKGEYSSRINLIILARMTVESEYIYDLFVDGYLNETSTSRDDLPRITFIKDFVPYNLLPALYNSADAFLLPSHGEGWGLPLMESMAMNKPTIGTKWSGNLAFMTEYNSLLVEIDGLESVPGNDKQRWATPSISSLRQHMRNLVDHKVENISSMTARARTDVLENFSYAPVSDLIIERLKVIQTLLPEVRRRKASLQPSWRSWSSGGSSERPLGTGPSPYGTQPVLAPTEPVFVDSDGITRYRAKIISD
eukprot:TRINITY_DN6015_c0_g1_i3.p1 TRINITY_DN6015_c0_g1~~TRINITY_DN6015_c0_g1_i3.p1  ORF type:complete len:748 (-),score=127.96 TRINITY_DN6015_c0_g1_i3:46-2289(-)